jgi:hypothetical protein
VAFADLTVRFLLPSLVTPPGDYYRLWVFALLQSTSDPSERLAFLLDMTVAPPSSASSQTTFGLLGLSSSVCQAPEELVVGAGSSTISENSPHAGDMGIAAGGSALKHVSVVLTSSGNVSVELLDVGRPGSSLNVWGSPLGYLYNFSYMEPLNNTRSSYVQMLAQCDALRFLHRKYTGICGFERYVGPVDWGSSTPYTKLYTDWLLHLDTSGSYGLAIAGLDGFSGGYQGASLLSPPTAVSVGLNRTCLAPDQANVYSVGAFTGCASIAAAPSAGFYWTMVTSAASCQGALDGMGWWEHIDRSTGV